METRARRPSTHDDEPAEGTHDGQDVPEPRRSRETGVLPAVKYRRDDSPAGETGMLPAVSIQPESMDMNDLQDASRTTAESSAIPLAQSLPDTGSGHAPTVLIIEDTVELAELLQVTLDRMGLTTFSETHGNKALARYYELKPDLVLLDIGLPDMTGWKLLEHIKDNLRDNGTMPLVIVITAYGDAANRLVGKLQNVYSYLVKPFTSDEVERVVSRALSGKVG